MTKTTKTSQIRSEIEAALESAYNKRRLRRSKRNLRHHIGRRDYSDVREDIDAATIRTGIDNASDPLDLAIIALDTEDRDRYRDIIASIPPVMLGKTKYRVAFGSRHGLELLGPRGGSSSLVKSINDPTSWAHNTMSGHSVKTVWYRRNPDFTFTRID